MAALASACRPASLGIDHLGPVSKCSVEPRRGPGGDPARRRFVWIPVLYPDETPTRPVVVWARRRPARHFETGPSDARTPGRPLRSELDATFNTNPVVPYRVRPYRRAVQQIRSEERRGGTEATERG